MDRNRIDPKWLRRRLSIIAKAQGGEDWTARRLRNRLVKVGIEGLTEGELELALKLIEVEFSDEPA